jgi:hypothetical protein
MSTKKTGWEALDNWVSEGAHATEHAGEAVAHAGKTGWEDLDKWVSKSPAAEGDAVASGTKTTGWEALDKWVGENGAPTEAGVAATGQAASGGGSAGSSGGGFMGWLKGLFGGK